MAQTEIERRIEQQFGLSRGIMLAVGAACLLIGILSMLLPLTLFESFLRVIGLFSIASGCVKSVQLLIGWRSARSRERSWPMILLQVGIDVALGLVLLNDWKEALGAATLAFGVLFVVEGLLLFYTGLRAPTIESRDTIMIAGVLTLAIGIVVVFRLVDNPLRWAGVLVGLKLVLFGGMLCWIALRSLNGNQPLLYEGGSIEPRAGELYAVYFGTAFHLGVYIGDGEVVHYLNDNHVYRVPWETFLSDRYPQHWTYPDLPPEPLDQIIATALGEVGKVYPYNLLRFNCENFAIYCKSAGKTRYSKYAQIASGVNSLEAYPLLGAIAELNTRAVEWLAFHFGGPAGRRLSLAIRRVGAAVTNWLVATAAK